jgi:hypothetical protein
VRAGCQGSGIGYRVSGIGYRVSGYQRGDEEIFNGTLASASARPQRSEESQGDGCPRPAFEVSAKGSKMTIFDDAFDEF